ncbi:MAG: hypothetical protein KC944_07025 [Candidatus Omnitrophica bacterium]|nr:hypothetical protein [Candidatus Omnitrophota bacterium]
MSYRTAPGEKRGVRTAFRAGSPHTLFVSKQLIRTIVVLLALSFSAPASAQDASEQGTGLDTLVEDLNVQGDNLRELIDLLATFGETNINVVGSVPQTKVNVNLKNKTIKEILSELSVLYDLYIDYQPGNTLIRPGSEKPEEQLQVIERDFRLNFSRPSEVEELVSPLLSNRPEAAIQAIDDLKVIRVSDIPEAVARIEAFINQIDVPQQSHVFRVLYADVEEVANIILERMPDLEETAITVDLANSQLIVRTTLENLNEIQLLIETLDIRKEIRVFHISFHEVEDVIAVLEDLELLSPEATIAPNEFTGKIIIQDTPERLDRIAEAIKAYDQPRPLVFFEAEILDVNADYNFNWNPEVNLQDSARSLTADGSDDITVIGDGQTFLEVSGDGAFNYAHLNASDYLVTLQTMESDSDVQTIASPRVLVEMREEARLNVGSEEPFGVRSFTSTISGVGNDFVTQRVREVGVRLIIYVRNISERGYVEVELGMENSSLGGRVDIGGDTQGLRVLTTNVETVAMIKDGRTLAVGGLVQRMESENTSGPPFLSKVPVVRYLFTNLSRQDTRRKLLLFVTPHILNIDTPLEKFMEEGGKDYSVLGEDEFDLETASLTEAPSGGTQWVNRGDRWGFIDDNGKFVDRTDLFLSAYKSEPESTSEPMAMEEGQGREEPSAKELLDQLDDFQEPEPIVEPAPQPPSEMTEQPEKIKVDSSVEPATPRPAPKAKEEAEAPRPKFARPLVGQEAMDALNANADSIGQFEGPLKDLLLQIQKQTGVNPGVTKIEQHDLPVRVNGKGKTYIEVLREALSEHGLVIQMRENRPPSIRELPKKPAVDNPVPNPPTGNESQSRAIPDSDPWGYAAKERVSRAAPIEAPRKNLSIEEWVAMDRPASNSQPYQPRTTPPKSESWEAPIEVDNPNDSDIWGYKNEYQNSPDRNLEWSNSRSGGGNSVWDELMGDSQSNVGLNESPSFSLNRHVKQPVRAEPNLNAQQPVYQEQRNPVSMQQPQVPPVEKKEEGKIKRFMGRLFGKD